MRKIYLASSWRNQYQPIYVDRLRHYEHEVYDFRNPSYPSPENIGFRWTEVNPEYKDEDIDIYTLIDMLEHPIAQEGFKADFDAMQWADTCVLLLPCGNSAHIKAGWMKGAGKKLHIVAPVEIRPDLMYAMSDSMCGGLYELLDDLDND